MKLHKLREYQSEAVVQIEGAIVFGAKEISLNGPTSFGKTITMAQFIKTQVDEGKSVVFMMNLTDLVKQTMETLKAMNVDFRVVAAEFDGYEFNHQSKVTIAMQQTLFARLNKVDIDCDVLVIDEFHRSFRTETMEAVKAKLNPDVVVGISGTNYDEKGYALPNVEIIETKTISELTKEKYLTPLKTLSVTFAEDMDYSESGSGEYSENFLNSVINNHEYNSKVVSAWYSVAKNMKTIVFSTGIDHSEALAAEFRAIGIEAEAYHSKLTKVQSRAVMDRFKKNKLQVMVSVNKVLVGFDDPSIECGVACRPTKTRRVWQQACGRMIRLFEGKKNAILLDCAQWTAEHGFYDENYHPPELNDKEALKKEKARLEVKVMKLIAGEKPTEVTRKIVDYKIEELDKKKARIPELSVKDLLAIYETSQRPLEILRVAFEMNRRKVGTTYTKPNVQFISKEWDYMISEYPQFKTRLLKTLRTMAKNKVSQGKKLAALHYTPAWLREQVPYLIDNPKIVNYDFDIEDDDIPF